ncbi:hypothetical protein PV327_002478 [Microctonus hyperodae]|uniref:Ionotropic glutamate receptor C-terminal domain-containing protein n=1 Tax=Microctonus hyperodae TaxID=165561 RepID=A0AA39FFN3_MICHY|nr:hypothetical protein PV327_002478 [Microctonus hyperodae]
MISLAHFLGLLLIFNGDKICLSHHCPLQDVSFISDINKQFNYSSVIFTSSANYESTFEWMIFARRLIKELSKNNIPSLGVDFNQLNKIIDIYRNRIIRPMIVVLLNTTQDLRQFESRSSKIDMNYPIWLMIFTNMDNSTALCRYCLAPSYNKFSLTFNIQMLVYCCCNPSGRINAWWSVDSIHTEYSYFGYWNLDTGLVYSNNYIAYNRRNNLNGKSLRVIYINGSAAFRVNKGKITGFFGEFITELSYVMNFTILPVVVRRDSIGKEFSRGKVDIGATELDFNVIIGNSNIDFTLPLATTKYQLYFKLGDSLQIQWSAYFQTFNIKVWMIILALIISSSVILTVIKYNKSTTSTAILIFENYLHIWGIFCQQGVSEFSLHTPLRIAYFSICLTAVIISATYSAAFISFLTLNTPDVPFSSFNEFVNQKLYKLIVCKDSDDDYYFSSVDDPVLKKAYSKVKHAATLPVTVVDGFDQICSEKVAFLVAELSELAAKPHPSCKFSSVDTGIKAPISILVPTNSRYVGLINHHIHQFQQIGLLQRLMKKYLYKQNLRVRKTDVSPVTLQKITPILTFIAAGVVIAVSYNVQEYININTTMVYRGHLQTDDPQDAPKLVRMTPLRTSRCETVSKPRTIAQSPDKQLNITNQSVKMNAKITPPKLRNINEIRESVLNKKSPKKQDDFFPAIGKIKSTLYPSSSSSPSSSARSQKPNSMLANLKDLERLRNIALDDTERVKNINNTTDKTTTRILTQKFVESNRVDDNHQRSTCITKNRIDTLTPLPDQPKAPIRRRKDIQRQQQYALIDSQESKSQHRPDILEGLIKESERQLEQLTADIGAANSTMIDDVNSDSEDKKKDICSVIDVNAKAIYHIDNDDDNDDDDDDDY